MSPPPPQSPTPPPRHHLLKKPTSLSDFIFAAASLFVVFSNSPKSSPIFFLPDTSRLSCPLNLRKFPRMSISFTSQPSPGHPGRLTPPFATPQSLSDWLKPRLSADLFGSWGVKPGTKNIHNLWLEIAQGETLLADSVPPIRTVEVVIVRIIRNDGKVLIESHQELSDGALRHRSRPLSEKMKPGESVEAAVIRAVREELGSVLQIRDFENVHNTIDRRDFSSVQEKVRILPGTYVKKVEERVSVSYPGLPACYVLHRVDAEVEGLPEDEFSTEEAREYGDMDDNCVQDSAVSCKKHFWKWVDCSSV